MNLHEVKRACDLYSRGQASVQQVARIANASSDVEDSLRRENARLRRLLSASQDRQKRLTAKLGTMQGHIHRLSAAADQRPVACEEIPSPATAYRVVSGITGVPVSQLAGQTRERRYTRPRWLAWMAVHRLCPELSAKQVGRVFGRDHSTVLNALRVGGAMLRDDPEYAKAFRAVCAALADLPETEAAE